jgi:hypothetical protein
MGKIIEATLKLYKFLTTFATNVASPNGRPVGPSIVLVIVFMSFTVADLLAWAWLAWEAQTAEAFLNGLHLSELTKNVLFGAHLFLLIGALVHFQVRYSSGPVGELFRSLTKKNKK